MTPAERARKWRRDNPERARELSRQSYRKHGSHVGAKTARRRYHLKKTYGITLEEYQRMLGEQNGVCGICKRPETDLRRGNTKSLDVDHNHETGEVRALLCSKCNAALGLLGEDAERILRLFDYVVEHNGN